MIRHFIRIFCGFILFFNFGLTQEKNFNDIDSIIINSIENRIFPGAQLLIGDKIEVIYYKNYGKFTYDDNAPSVSNESMFDIASLTKVVAATSAIMNLYYSGEINLSDKIGKYIPGINNSDKEQIEIINLLLHNSGLKAWEPFYSYCSNKDDIINAICSIGTIYPAGEKFTYSDLNFILLGEIVEKVSGLDLNLYSNKYIFDKLGMNNTMYNPPDDIKSKILPTEYDRRIRNKLIQGEVHDENAFIMGGISGHAGIFSNSMDLYKFMKMLLNYGKFYNPYSRGLKEDHFCNTDIIITFTKKFEVSGYQNTRALGWDTKSIPENGRPQCGEIISDNCFGHTGFTGTSIWCDVDREIIVIFLTNRVYPDRKNNGIKEIRPQITNAILNKYSIINK